MSKEAVQELLDKGADDRKFRVKYDNTFTMERFVEVAKEDGYEFTVEELKEVIRKNGE